MQTMGILGLALTALVLAQLGLVLFSAGRRLVHERRQQRLALDLLQARVAAAHVHRAERERSQLAWEGYRKFIVTRKVREADGICSFYITPHDRKELPPFQPGQYVTLRVHHPEHGKPLIRCYSLSDAPRPEYYRITIKRVTHPDADCPQEQVSVSNFFHDRVHEGGILDVEAPRGKFVLDLIQQTPIVLIGGGIGVTPLLSMINTLADLESHRQVRLFYGIRHGREHVMRSHFRHLARTHKNIHIYACYSDPRPDDVEGRDFDVRGRVTVELLRRVLPSNNFEFYICGPPPMMADLTRNLKEWGVPEDALHTEAFGPAAAKSAALAPAAGASSGTIQVSFSRSDKSLCWNGEAGNLLDFARANGVHVASGCRAGHCGACEMALHAGGVRYLLEPSRTVQAGRCLTCVSVPTADVVLDA